MNKVVLVGRLTAKPELRYTASNTAYTRFSVAVNRNFTNADGKRDADFINVVAWRKQAETISKYFDKRRENNGTNKHTHEENITLPIRLCYVRNITPHQYVQVLCRNLLCQYIRTFHGEICLYSFNLRFY